jgi:hypothetical protein
VAEDWVRFHRDLTRGKWSTVPRAIRMVLMEISLLCKPGGGICELPPATSRSPDPVSRCADMLGGDRKEARRAIRALALDGDESADPTITFVTPAGAKLDPSRCHVGAMSVPSQRLLVLMSGFGRRNPRLKSHGILMIPTPPAQLTKQMPLLEERRGDQRRVDPSGGAKPRRTRKKKAPKKDQPRSTPATPKPSTPLSQAWGLWRELYREAYDATYASTGADGKFIKEIAAAADGHAKERAAAAGGDLEEVRGQVLDHWFRRYLAIDGFKDSVRNARHPLRMLGRDIPSFGLPWDHGVDAPPPRPRRDEQPAATSSGCAAAAPSKHPGYDGDELAAPKPDFDAMTPEERQAFQDARDEANAAIQRLAEAQSF